MVMGMPHCVNLFPQFRHSPKRLCFTSESSATALFICGLLVDIVAHASDNRPVMEHSKLKLRIGAHEFEAEGPPELVTEQFNAFKELIATLPAPTGPSASPSLSLPLAPPSVSPSASVDPALQVESESLMRIMKVDDRIVSLTVRARSIDDAVLLLLYGQKSVRGNDSVTGAEIMGGLTSTGIRVNRVDRLLESAGEIGDVIVVGSGRAKRYRLTNSGFAKARAIAGELIASVP